MMMLSSTYRMQSRPDPGSEAERVDPANVLLHRMPSAAWRPRRSATRSWPSPAGSTGPSYGPSVLPHLTPFMDGRGRPGKSGPLDGDGRRSLYINVRRNFLTPMFLAFDFPVPSSHHRPARRLERPRPGADPDERPLRRPAGPPLGRPRAAPTPRGHAPKRIAAAVPRRVRPPADRRGADRRPGASWTNRPRPTAAADDPRAWADLCHVLINVKEFIFID